FSKLLADQSTLIYENPLNATFDEKIFAPRQFVQINEKTVPSAFLGFIIMVGLFRSISEHLFLFVGPVLSTLCLIYIYKLAEFLYIRQSALISISIAGLFPPFLYLTLSYYDYISYLTFLNLCIYYLYLALHFNNLTCVFLSRLMLSSAIWIIYAPFITLPIC